MALTSTILFPFSSCFNYYLWAQWLKIAMAKLYIIGGEVLCSLNTKSTSVRSETPVLALKVKQVKTFSQEDSQQH